MPPLTYNMFNLVAATIGDPPRPVSFPEFYGVRLPVYPDHERKFGIPTPQTLGKHILFLELHNLVVVYCYGDVAIFVELFFCGVTLVTSFEIVIQSYFYYKMYTKLVFVNYCF